MPIVGNGMQMVFLKPKTTTVAWLVLNTIALLEVSQLSPALRNITARYKSKAGYMPFVPAHTASYRTGHLPVS